MSILCRVHFYKSHQFLSFPRIIIIYEFAILLCARTSFAVCNLKLIFYLFFSLSSLAILRTFYRMMTKHAQNRKRFGRRNFKQRYFRLTTHSLSYAKAKGKRPICDIPLTELVAVERLEEKSFKLQNIVRVSWEHLWCEVIIISCKLLAHVKVVLLSRSVCNGRELRNL